MKRTTSLITTGALALGTTALLGGVAPGTASASGCGVTTLDRVGLESTFNGALSGVGGGATAEMLPGGLRMTTPSAAADPDRTAYAAWFMDGLDLALADATAQSNYALDTTPAAGQPIANHPTYELYVDLDGPGAAGEDLLVHWAPEAGEPTDVWESIFSPLTAMEPDASEAPEEGTLVAISAAYPDAVVTGLGFQLIDQPGADVTVHGMTFGCNEFVFTSGPGGGEEPDPTGNQAPIAAVTHTNQGRTFTFSAAGSTDSDGRITRYAWDFGDGSAPAAGADVVHRYAAAGTHTVTLTVTDDDGATTTATRDVVVPQDGPTGPTDPDDPAEPTEYGTPLPNTGADVLGLAAVGGLVLAGGAAGLVASRRRRAGSAS